MAISFTRKREETSTPEIEAAKQAVEQYKEAKNSYEELVDKFRSSYPEAASELEAIRQVGDQVVEAISRAKKAVAAAKTTVGDFFCQRKFSQPGYDPELVVKICVDTEDKQQLFELFKSGVVKDVKFDREAATLFFESRQLEKFASAWADKQELTPAVTPPKFTP